MEKPAQTPNGAPHRRRRRRPAGNGSAPQAPQPAREGKASAQPREPRKAAPQNTAVPNEPGLDLISRRPPKQKFANFEDYLAAHGGMTVPLPPAAADAPEAETPAPAAEATE